MSSLAVSLQVLLGLLLAMILRQKMATWMRYYYRTTFLLPMLMSGAATAIVLGYMLHKEFGAVNYYLGRLGIPPIPWLTQTLGDGQHDHVLPVAVRPALR